MSVRRSPSRSDNRLEPLERSFHRRSISFGETHGDDREGPRLVVVEGLGDLRATLDLLEFVAPYELREVVPRDATVLFEFDDSVASDVAQSHLHLHGKGRAEGQSLRG